MADHIFQDWKANKKNIKAQLVLLAFRIAQKVRRWPLPLLLLGVPYLVFYRVQVEWILGIELPWNLRAGPRLRIFHGQALVVHSDCIIGTDCILRHSTTLGMAATNENPPKLPVLGNFVDVGSNVCIIGAVRIGNHVTIGAGSVVVKDVPDHAIVVGNPARVLRIKSVEVVES